jgi:hypothetical protein
MHLKVAYKKHYFRTEFSQTHGRQRVVAHSSLKQRLVMTGGHYNHVAKQPRSAHCHSGRGRFWRIEARQLELRGQGSEQYLQRVLGMNDMRQVRSCLR